MIDCSISNKVSNIRIISGDDVKNNYINDQVNNCDRYGFINLENLNLTKENVEQIIKLIKNEKKEKVVSIALTTNNLGALPENLNELPKLIKLYANNIDLKELTELDKGVIGNLKYINLEHNYSLSDGSKEFLKQLKKDKEEKKEQFIMSYTLTGDELNQALGYPEKSELDR